MDPNTRYNPSYYTSNNPNLNFQENTYQRKYNNFNQAFKSNEPIIEKTNFNNLNNMIHNNMKDIILKQDIIEYNIDIDSITRNQNIYPNPFNYTVSFTTSSLTLKTKNHFMVFDNSPNISRTFKNVKYIRINCVNLPKCYDLSNSSDYFNEGYNKDDINYCYLFDKSLKSYNPLIESYYNISNFYSKDYNPTFDIRLPTYSKFYNPIFDISKKPIFDSLLNYDENEQQENQQEQSQEPSQEQEETKTSKEYDEYCKKIILSDYLQKLYKDNIEYLNKPITLDILENQTLNDTIKINDDFSFVITLSNTKDNHQKYKMLDDVLESIDVSNPLLKTYDKENEKYNQIYDTSIYSSEKTLLSLEVSNSNLFPDKYNPNHLIYCPLFDENIPSNSPTKEELEQLKYSIPEMPLYNPLNQYYNPEFDKFNPNFNSSKLYSFGYVKDLIPCIFPLIPYIKKYNPTYEINEKYYSLYYDRFIIMTISSDFSNNTYSTSSLMNLKGIKLFRNQNFKGDFFNCYPCGGDTYYFKDNNLYNLNKLNIKFYNSKYEPIEPKNLNFFDDDLNRTNSALNYKFQNNISLTIGVIENEMNMTKIN